MSLIRLHWCYRRVLSAVKDVALRSDLNAFSPQSMANLAWACATLGYKDMQLFEAGLPANQLGLILCVSFIISEPTINRACSTGLHCR